MLSGDDLLGEAIAPFKASPASDRNFAEQKHVLERPLHAVPVPPRAARTLVCIVFNLGGS